ncbi:MAG: alpha/beta fold hydrolase [Acidimicrobiales bacterium]
MERIIESNDGVGLHLHHLGGGAGQRLLICHATGFHGRAYAPLAGHLAERFDVWALDFRGHGSSTEPRSGDFSWEGMAADVLACIDDLGGSSVYAVGHSMGGAAILLAELARPGAIIATYLFEPIVFPEGFIVGRGDNSMAAMARRRRSTFASKAEAHERYAGRPPLDALHPEALAAYVEFGFVPTDDGMVTLACTPENEARTFEADDKMTIDLVRDLELQVATACGRTSDGPGPAEFAIHTARAMPNAVLRRHDDLGHFGPLEAPSVIAAEIIDELAPR